MHNDWLLNAQKKPAGGWWKEMWNKEGHLETKVLWGRVEELRSKVCALVLELEDRSC